MAKRPGTRAPDDRDTDPEIPRSVARLWKRADRRSRAPHHALSLERIVAAAIEIADAEGLPALSMARIAERLGCAPMSLYRHVDNKEELQVIMTDTASGSPPAADAGARPWRRRLERWARDLRAVYYRHPWILQIAAGRPPLEPGQLAWLDAGLRTLKGARLEPDETLSVILLIVNYVRGEAQIATGLLQADKRTRQQEAEMQAWYGRMMARLIDAKRFPALTELSAAGVFGPADGDHGHEATFEFGLARILDGLEAYVRPRAR
jgi:AcrR family transcriptional regulator